MVYDWESKSWRKTAVWWAIIFTAFFIAGLVGAYQMSEILR